MAAASDSPLTSASFAGRIGETFEARAADGTPVELKLVRCDETPYGDPDQWRGEIGRVPFSLEFLTDSDHAAGQQIFRLSDAEIGALDVFMTPVGSEGDSLLYEAVFS